MNKLNVVEVAEISEFSKNKHVSCGWRFCDARPPYDYNTSFNPKEMHHKAGNLVWR